MRLPSGYGSVTKLSGNRRRPYLVKKTTGWDERGYPIVDIIGYTVTREEGLELLAQYNRNPWNIDQAKITLKELYKLWEEKKAVKLGSSNRANLASAFKHCKKLERMPYRNIRSFQMQDTIDQCGRGYATQAAIKNLWGHLDKFAMEMDVINRCYSDLITSAPVLPTSRDRFSSETISRIWEHQGEPWVDTILIFIYSGWRISELLTMKKSDVDLTVGTMKGGVKTAAGKNRIVPIHSLIRPMVEERMKEPGEYLIQWNGKACSVKQYRMIWKELSERIGIPGTPHCCRHTFESLLDGVGANRKCIDLLMGHVSKDTGNRVYNHKTLEDLKANIELITY